jgi:6-phosphogluconolactonase
VYRHDPRTGAITAHTPAFVGLEPGAGPRHLAVHPSKRYVYVLTELSSHVAMFAWNPTAGTLVQRQSVATVPVGTPSSNSTAEIVVHPNGRFVYASNRGHDSIAVFSVDARDGRPDAPRQHADRRERAAELRRRPEWSLAPRGQSALELDRHVRDRSVEGTLTPNGATLAVPRPVCVAFAPSVAARG